MTEQNNQLRLNIEVNTLKQHQFTAQLYFVIRPIAELNMKPYRSSPTVAITNPRVQTKITNCFKSYLFEAGKGELRNYFNTDLVVELHHSDRMKKDQLLGLAKIRLAQVLKQPLLKSNTSYVLTYDVWAPVDEVDEQENPVRKIGAIRIIAYLEDLGPVSLLRQKGIDFKNLLADDDVVQIQNGQAENNQYINNPLPSEKLNTGGLDQQKRLELNNLQHQVVWELESWKKAEEARTRLVLKQKQADFWASLHEEQKKNDLQKEKHFKKIEANLTLQQNKLKAKMNELIKREQKIIVMQQQLQTKMNEISREVFLKDQQIERLKRKHKEQKTVTIKQKSTVQIELAKLKAQNAKLKVELEQARKEDEKGPINILKNQLNHKITQIKALRKQLQNCMQTKQQFKQSYQKMKRQVIQRGAIIAEKTDQLNSSNHEISLLKKDIKHLEEKLVYLKQQQFYSNNYGYGQPAQNDDDQAPLEFNSEKERLMYRRREMLESGGYTTSDPLIREIDKKIAALH